MSTDLVWLDNEVGPRAFEGRDTWVCP